MPDQRLKRFTPPPSRSLAEAATNVAAWLDDDAELRIPDTDWGHQLSSDLRDLVAAAAGEQRDPQRLRRHPAELTSAERRLVLLRLRFDTLRRETIEALWSVGGPLTETQRAIRRFQTAVEPIDRLFNPED